MENNIPPGVTDPADQEGAKIIDCVECSGRGHDDFDDECRYCEGTGKREQTFEESVLEREEKQENQSDL